VIAIGFTVLSVDFVLSTFDPNIYPYRIPEMRWYAAACVVVAAVSAATSFGLLLLSRFAAIASLVLFAIPTVLVGTGLVVMSVSDSKFDDVAKGLCIFLIPGLCLVVASIRALVYSHNARRLGTPGGLPRNPFQRRLFQSRRNLWATVFSLGLTAIAPVVATFAYAGVFLAVPQLLPTSVRYDGYEASLTSYAHLLDHPVTFVGACLVALGAGAFFFFRACRYARASAAELRARDRRPPIVFLRSFKDDQIAFRSWLRAAKVTLDEDVTEALAIYGPVVAIGRPGETLPPLGSARHYVPDSEWRERATGLITDAQAIVAVLGATAGIRWELDTIIQLHAVRKLLLVIPPVPSEDLRDRWNVVPALLHEFATVPESVLLGKLLIVGLDVEGQPFVITSNTRTEGDYYEAMGSAERIRQGTASAGDLSSQRSKSM